MNKSLLNSAIRYLSRRPRSEKEVRDYLTKKQETKIKHKGKKSRPERDPESFTQKNEILHLVHSHSNRMAQDDNREIQSEMLQQREHVNDQHDEREAIITQLKELKFINDEEFARWWIQNRTRSRPKGWRVIQMELQQKGMSREMIQNIRYKMEEDTEKSRNTASSEAMTGQSDFEMSITNIWEDTPRDEYALARGLAEKKMRQLKELDKQTIYRRLGGFLGRRGFDLDVIKRVIDEVLTKHV